MPAACRLRTIVLNSRTVSKAEVAEAYSMFGAKKQSVLYPQ